MKIAPIKTEADYDATLAEEQRFLLDMISTTVSLYTPPDGGKTETPAIA